MLAAAQILRLPSASSFSHCDYQLAISFFPSISSTHFPIEGPRPRTGIHLHGGLSYPFGSCPSSSMSVTFTSGRLGSSAGEQNGAAVTEELSSIELIEDFEEEAQTSSSDVIQVSVEKIGRNRRRVSASIPINVPLEAVWNTLTDYDRLADFLPGLAVSKLQDRWENGATLFQIGEQNLAFGLKFRAKVVVKVHERPLEDLPCGIRREIFFEMIEGDFKIFNGTWRMEQTSTNTSETSDLPISGSAVSTSLTYQLEVQPEVWLPVGLVEGRLRNEVQTNLFCVQDEALKRHLSLQVD